MKLSTRWILLGLVALGLVAGVVRAVVVKRQQAQAAASTTLVQSQIELGPDDVIRAEPRDLVQSLPITGTVKAVNFAAIKARVAGEIKEFAVREGDVVKAGQVLARIDPVEYQNRWQQAREQAEAAKSQLDIAQRQWDTNKALVDQGFISKVALDNSQASLQGALSSYKAAVSGADVARKALDDAVLRAPFAGVVASRLAQAGERVAIDTKLLEVVDPSNLEVEVALSASDSVDVRVGQTARLQVEDRAGTVGAKVKRVSPSAQAGTRSVLVFLALEGADGLRHGLFVKGSLGLAQMRALAVPLNAVRTDRAQPYVQVVQDGANGPQVAHKTVQLGARGYLASSNASLTADDADLWVQVTGVDDGSPVILGQLGSLREGLTVKQAAPAAAKP
jgi:multidrug efflux system membrane fusion protein